MPSPDLCIRGQRVITLESDGPAAVHVRGGRVERVAAFDDVPGGCPLVEAGDAVVLPGLVDSHVHRGRAVPLGRDDALTADAKVG